jgi:hypothetical protein
MPDQGDVIEVDMPCLVPYEIFHSWYNAGLEQFQDSMLGSSGQAGVTSFWKHAMQEDWAKRHPVVTVFKENVDQLLPLTWHLDGGEVHRNSEFLFLNVGSVLAQASATHSLDARALVAGLPHALMKVPKVKQAAMKLFGKFAAWNHNVMRGKVMPNRGFYNENFKPNSIRARNAGKQIMGNYVGVFLGTKSDGKARVPCVPQLPCTRRETRGLGYRDRGWGIWGIGGGVVVGYFPYIPLKGSLYSILNA